MTIKELTAKAKKENWGLAPKDRYYSPALWQWLEVAHPEVLKDFKEWFNKKVRVEIKMPKTKTVKMTFAIEKR